MASVRPFKIDVPQVKLDRLQQKLALADFPDEPSHVEPWSRGVPLPTMKQLVRYWREKYDWRKAEAQLNRFPQYTTQVELDGFGTYNVHFVHRQSEVKNAIPLLFIHGWPSSFMEAIKILPELVKGGPEFPAFHVVAPSLMDYGFSDSTRKRGFGVNEHAEIFNKLMHVLGYNQYVVQAGDVGYLISRFLVQKYPESCRAHHANMTQPNKPTQEDNPDLFAKMVAIGPTKEDEALLARHGKFFKEEAGYFHIQSTRPQTIAYSLADSPVGLLAWIYDKLVGLTDDYPFTEDEILTWISIHWFSTAGPGAPPRIYYEFCNKEPTSEIVQSGRWADAPLGVARFPKEPSNLPKLWHEGLGPIVQWTEFTRGGHFAAYEMPKELLAEVRKMYGKDGGAAGIVEGRSGYD
ncbi:hypothetical protein AYO20_09685 [Fonsecaea nubica]|uniref:Epoxide hydrolase N-terminal domain-containing protein n=1 Tax=Fonsecaea nubica TaxID=856822 RepID=A0A178CFN0_9EURO|nr:hypothetical protein AYO20_09685 [Fonsecaea nubica]OAL27832.1 hypothetical protein AYO20_09685 [Fonsecaea nubica]